MTLAMWSKIVGIFGGLLTTSAGFVPGMMWKGILGAGGAALMSVGVVIASSTSAGHPDGEQTTKDQSAPFVSK